MIAVQHRGYPNLSVISISADCPRLLRTWRRRATSTSTEDGWRRVMGGIFAATSCGSPRPPSRGSVVTSWLIDTIVLPTNRLEPIWPALHRMDGEAGRPVEAVVSGPVLIICLQGRSIQPPCSWRQVALFAGSGSSLEPHGWRFSSTSDRKRSRPTGRLSGPLGLLQ